MFEVGDFGFEDEDAPDAGEGHALTGHLRHSLHLADVPAAVTALSPAGARRLHHILDVDSAQERRLDAEHGGDLADGVQGRVLVVEGEWHPISLPHTPAVTRSSDFVSIAVCTFSPTLIGTRRGLAFSAIGSRKVNTPSAYWASMRSVSSVSPKNN